MLDRQYVRAEYDEDRGCYVSVEADLIDGEPSLVYGFILQPIEDSRPLWKGCLEKVWYEADGEWDSEAFFYATYSSEDVFDADVEQILKKARQISTDENIDEFLAVIDSVKERAVTMGFEEDTIEELEGLFQNGPEDAYTLTDIGDGPRLHDHVECDDECWYLRLAPVVDSEKQPLGWGLFAVHFPDYPPETTTAELKKADRARILLIDHLHSRLDAGLAQRGFEHFMETERLDNPEFAYMNDTEVVEGTAVNVEWNEETGRAIWTELSSQALRDFLNDTVPFVYPREKWQMSDKPRIDRYFDENPQPVWLEDQLRSILDAHAGVEPDEAENSPWQDLDLE